ncbi:ATP-binding protein [Alkalithermobacter paradoxus]|uniref:AAA-like domain protein n=1 Tax=Alkalithermobacter paradoxus TaxID=29349 RepID=A0A1V4I4Y6_9FIRM|nr:AAA-like domain protein [[Clostridium] thermoalcaliphilum]
MQVVGFTTQQEVSIATKERPFKINEILIIEDEYQNDQLAEVYETMSYNKHIPLNVNEGFIDSNMVDILNSIGYKVGEETIHIAKARLLVEADYPISTGACVRKPRFEEVKNIFLKCKKEDGLLLGEIKSTEDMEDTLEDELKDLFCIYDKSGIRKQKGVPFIFDIKKMQQYPHIGIFGGSGSGKSFGIRVMLEEIMKLNIPTIVLDPHFEMDFSNQCPDIEDKYRDDFSNKFNIYQIGIDVGVKFDTLDKNELKKLLSVSGALTDSMSNVVDTIYKNKDTYITFSTRLEELKEGQALGSVEKIDKKISEASDRYERDKYIKIKETYSKYEKTCPPASVSGIIWRLNRLNNEGIFAKDIIPVEECLKEGKLAVIQGDMRLIQVFSTYLLNRMYLKRREYKDAKSRKQKEGEFFPPFIIATDEAHNFAPKGYDSPSKSIIKEIAQEGRKYGVFLVLATQRPTLLDETITAQLNTKFVFRTVRASDIGTIKEETDISAEEGKRLPYLRSGDSFISSAILGRTIPVRIRMAKTTSPHTENPFEELQTFISQNKDKIYEAIKDKLPIREMQMNDIIVWLEKNGIKMNAGQLKKELDKLVHDKKIVRKETMFGSSYENIS